MPSLRLALLVAACSLAALPTPASAGYVPGGATPGSCAGPFFDRVGTSSADSLTADTRPERIYGLGGADRLNGSPTRAACLFGGTGIDLLSLAPGGGIAFGEIGSDVLVGSQRNDALSGGPGADTLVGRGGTDVLRGDTGVDAFDAGDGDDAIVSSDRRREVVACGSGKDSVVADRGDALFGCEKVRRIQGTPLPSLRVTPRSGGSRSIFRLRFRVPKAGGPGSYVVLGSRCGQTAPVALTAVPAPGRRVRAGQTIRLGVRPPAGGWCVGTREAVVARIPACPPGQCYVAPPADPFAAVPLRIRR